MKLDLELKLDVNFLKSSFVISWVYTNEKGCNKWIILFLEMKKYIFLCKRNTILPSYKDMLNSLRLAWKIYKTPILKKTSTRTGQL